MKIYLLMGHVRHEYDAPMIAFIDQSKAIAKLEELSMRCQDPKMRCLGEYDSYSVKEMELLP